MSQRTEDMWCTLSPSHAVYTAGLRRSVNGSVDNDDGYQWLNWTWGPDGGGVLNPDPLV